jgi:hypothetical protein
MHDRSNGRIRWLAVAAVMCSASMIACSEDDRARQIAPVAPALGSTPSALTKALKSSKSHYSLGIVGYNYTEVGVADYRVNGTGAFNLGVSTETSGGGSTVCCVGWASGTKLPMPVRVEWTRDGKRWCRTTALMNGPIPLEPTTLEVHFYPDRHVEVAITDNYSPPRLKLAAGGGAYRVAVDVQAELKAAIQQDEKKAECRAGEFPIGSAMK